MTHVSTLRSSSLKPKSCRKVRVHECTFRIQDVTCMVLHVCAQLGLRMLHVCAQLGLRMLHVCAHDEVTADTNDPTHLLKWIVQNHHGSVHIVTEKIKLVWFTSTLCWSLWMERVDIYMWPLFPSLLLIMSCKPSLLTVWVMFTCIRSLQSLITPFPLNVTRYTLFPP